MLGQKEYGFVELGKGMERPQGNEQGTGTVSEVGNW